MEKCNARVSTAHTHTHFAQVLLKWERGGGVRPGPSYSMNKSVTLVYQAGSPIGGPTTNLGSF